MAQARKTSDRPDQIGTGQAARLLGVSEQFVRWLANNDRLAYEMTPLGRLYLRADVERLRRDREAA